MFLSPVVMMYSMGHLQFFKEAKALGTHLTVNFASASVLLNHKQRTSSLPDEHKQALLKQWKLSMKSALEMTRSRPKF